MVIEKYAPCLQLFCPKLRHFGHQPIIMISPKAVHFECRVNFPLKYKTTEFCADESKYKVSNIEFDLLTPGDNLILGL